MNSKNLLNASLRASAALLCVGIVTVGLGGCATTIDQSTLDQRTANAVGQPVGTFTISERTEESGGRINYTVKTRSGAVYHCYLYSPTTFVKAMTFGQTPNSDAICSPMGRGAAASEQGKPAGTCNALLKAAGKC